ncbi:MAG: pyridoxamine 5'-phosphate oxidase family protein [bacterium]
MEFNRTKINTVKQAPKRAFYDKETIYPIVDEALICHVGFSIESQPFIIPTIHARRDDTIYLHGSTKSRLINHIESGNTVCISVALLDGLVLARSVFHHSMNYRSAVLFGKGKLVGRKEKLEALELITEKLFPGRWNDARPPNGKELKGTAIVAIDIENASAKIRTGGPNDNPEDYDLDYWAGVIPIKQIMLEPIPDEKLKAGIELPRYIEHFFRGLC